MGRQYRERQGWRFFIDQDYFLFKHIISYLRSKENPAEDWPIQSLEIPEEPGRNAEQEFYRMLEYYGLTDGIYPTKLKLIVSKEEGSDYDPNSVEIYEPHKIKSTKKIDFLVRDGHRRRIKTFEVTLGTVQWVKIG